MPKEAITNLSRAEAEFIAAEEGKENPAAVVGLIALANDRWAVTIDTPDGASPLAMTARLAAAASVSPPSRSPPFELGSLSARYESNGKPGAIGFDSVGGFSYGSYQIAARTGTMKAFLNFLRESFPSAAAKLAQAGGNAAAVAGTDAFKAAWKLLAKNPAFNAAQHDFIKSTHYDIFAKKLISDLDLDLAVHSIQLKNVAWSVAVQHGPANSIFKNALDEKPVPALKDREIIIAVYDERSDVDRYFPSSSAQIKKAIRARYATELQESVKGL